MTISQRDLGSRHGPAQGLPVEARIFAAAAVVVSLVGLAVVAVAWMPWSLSFGGLEGIASVLTDSSMPLVAALALSVLAIGWIYVRLRRSRYPVCESAFGPEARVSDDRWKAIEGRLSDLQAQLSNIHERQTYLRATLSTLQNRNEELRKELEALKAEYDEARERKAATNRKLLDAVESLANGSLASLESQAGALQRLREDFEILSETVGKGRLERAEDGWQATANEP